MYEAKDFELEPLPSPMAGKFGTMLVEILVCISNKIGMENQIQITY